MSANQLDNTKYTDMVNNASSNVKISSSIFKDFIGDVKDVVNQHAGVINENSASGQYAADAGSTDSYSITLSPAPTSYFSGMVVRFKANTSNTGTATLNVNGLGAKTIKKNYNTDLETGDIVANQIVEVIYDGSNFQMASTGIMVVSGTWTPTVAGGSTAGTNTYSTQSGSYYKIGKMVVVTFNIVLATKDAAMTGGLQITGLPYSANGEFVATMGRIEGITLGASYTHLIGFTSGNVIVLEQVKGTWDPLLPADISGTAAFRGSLTYTTT